MNLKDIMFKSWNDNLLNEENARLKNIQKLIDFYNGEQIPYLKEYIKLKNLDDFPFYETNITRRIIKKISEVYKKAPIRYLNETRNDKYEKLTALKNIKMKLAERQSRLLGIIGVRPYINEKGIFDYQILRSFTAYLKGLKPVTIKYLIAEEGQERFYEYWTDTEHLILNSNNIPIDSRKFDIDDEGENIYGVIPFVWCPNEFIIDDFYNTGGSADDLISANLHIDLKLSEMSHKYRYAAFSPIWGKGNVNTKDVKYGYNSILWLDDPEAQVGNLGIDHNFITDIEILKFEMQLIERNYGLNINWGISGDTSGFALVVQNIDHKDDLESFTDVCRTWESDIYIMEKVIGKAHGITVPEGDFRIDYADVNMPISIQEQNAKWTFEFEHELASKADYLRQQNPDITDEQIEEKLKQISKEKVLLKTEQRTEPTVTDLFNA